MCCSWHVGWISESSLCSVCKMRHRNPLAYFDGFGTSAPVTLRSITSITVKHYWMTFRIAGHSVLKISWQKWVCSAGSAMHVYSKMEDARVWLWFEDPGLRYDYGDRQKCLADRWCFCLSLSFLFSVSFPQSPYSSWSSPIIKRSRSPAGKQHNGGGV